MNASQNNIQSEIEKVTRLEKEGYIVTTSRAILVFDYYEDPDHKLEKQLKEHRHQPVIFLVTSYGDNVALHGVKKPKHDHELPRYEREELDPESVKKHEGGHRRDEDDHFNHDIFNLAQDRERIYVMSDDITANPLRSDVDIAWIHAGNELDRLPAGVKVKALPTNLKGVSYLVTMPDGETIYYAGTEPKPLPDGVTPTLSLPE